MSTPMRYRGLRVGDPAPHFVQRCGGNAAYRFDSVAGRYVVICFYGSLRDEAGCQALELAWAHPEFFDDERATFFGVSVDPEDEASGRARTRIPGVRHFWDFDGRVSRLYGALPQDAQEGEQPVRRHWLVLNPALQVMAAIPFADDGMDRQRVMRVLRDLAPVACYGGVEMHAPVLLIPQVFEPELCRRLIDLYDQHGGEASGVMKEQAGRTVGVHDLQFKSRRDHTIEEAAIRADLQVRVQRRVLPWMKRAYSFQATRMERYIIGCYDAADAGHFSAHRDNTTRGTAHRRFALSINLNDDFEGGELEFPEFGTRRYKMPAGGAVVFAGALLHRVTRVSAGRRYAFLPFLYDEAAAREREANNAYLGDEVEAYRASTTSVHDEGPVSPQDS